MHLGFCHRKQSHLALSFRFDALRLEKQMDGAGPLNKITWMGVSRVKCAKCRQILPKHGRLGFQRGRSAICVTVVLFSFKPGAGKSVVPVACQFQTILWQRERDTSRSAEDLSTAHGSARRTRTGVDL
jgi:hypothetical protein